MLPWIFGDCPRLEFNLGRHKMGSKILVVDDEREIADVVELYLKNENYQVVKCYNGRDALEAVEKEKPDLALLDVMLPDIDGFIQPAEDP